MSKQFKGRVVLVTGAATGIGRISAVTFAREGAKVVIADVNQKGGEETLTIITKSGGEATFIRTDVSNAADVEKLIKKIVETYGRLDCAHNNAGIEGTGFLTGDYTEEEWDRVININLKGIWLCMRYEIPQMIEQRGGVIVNTSSAAGLKGFPYHSAYSASKHAVIGLSRTAALEYAKRGIRINVVCPGFIRVGLTEKTIASDPAIEGKYKALIPMGRFGEAEEVAEAVIWLCSDAASFVTGHTMLIDGGASA
jgi:NAD(P)-dependent dehydrogenase (short-subunit alcohol dehydrogenase family)